MADVLIRLDNLSKVYGSQTILNGVSLDIYDGEFLTLLGPSGCGKTTILRLIAGFEQPTTGKMILKGQEINHLPANQRSANTVFQSYALFPHMDIFQNVAFGLKMKHIGKEEIQQRVMDALKIVKLEAMVHRKPHQLSGGQQQRIAIARAIVNRPAVLLLDEALSALDYKLRKEMQVELKQLQRRLGITFIFVTHDQEEALSMSDRVAVMNHGHFEQVDTPVKIYESPRNLFVAKFVGEVNIFEGQVTAVLEKKIQMKTAETTLTLNAAKPYHVGQTLYVLVRPEDFRIERQKENIVYSSHLLQGSIREIIYKGTTIDMQILLLGGQIILASEFYNEDSDALDYQQGETVYVSWVDGWEVILEE